MPQSPIAVMAQHGFTSAPVPHFVFRPGAPGGAKGNVYTDWVELYDALQASKDQGIRYLEFDSKFSPVLGPTGIPACRIPAGTWDMLDVIWTVLEPVQLPPVVITFEDFAFITNLQLCHGFQCQVIHNGTAHSPIRLGSRIFEVDGGFWHFFNTVPGAKPVFKVDSGVPTTTMFIGGGGNVSTFGRSSGTNPIPTATPAPVIDINGSVLTIGLVSGAIGAKSVTDSSSGALGTLVVHPRDDAANAGWDFGVPSTVTVLVRLNSHPLNIIRTPLVSVPVYNATYNELVLVKTDVARTVQLPSAKPCTGERVTVKDATGGASSNPIMILPVVGQLVEDVGLAPGSSAIISTSYRSKTWVADGAGNWRLVAVA